MIQQVVDALGLFMDGDDLTLTPELARNARLYADACDSVNATLRRCNDLLKRGLRGEAIHLAEAEPRVLDLVTILDFPQRQQYQQLASTYDLPTPGGLLLDVAQALNEAYAEQSPVDSFLAKFRRLNLARAPLPQRIALLRKIAAADPTQTIWEDDLRVLEKAHFAECLNVCQNVAKQWQTDQILETLQDIESGQYLETPSPNTLSTFKKLLARCAEGESALVARKLKQCQQDNDVPAARIERDRWNFLAEYAEKDGAYSIAASNAAPPLKWLAGIDSQIRHTADAALASKELKAALQNSTIGLEEFQGIGERVRALSGAIPNELQLEFDQKLQDLVGRRKLTKLSRVAAMTLGSITLVLLLTWMGLSVSHSRTIAAVRRSAEKLGAEEKWKDAVDLIEASPGYVRANTDIESLRSSLSRDASAEQNRQDNLAAAFKLLENHKPISEVSPVMPIATIERLAKNESEKERLKSIIAERTQFAQTHREQSLAELRGEKDQLLQECLRVSQIAATAPDLQALSARIDKLREQRRQLAKRALQESINDSISFSDVDAPMETAAKWLAWRIKMPERVVELCALDPERDGGLLFFQALNAMSIEAPLGNLSKELRLSADCRSLAGLAIEWTKLTESVVQHGESTNSKLAADDLAACEAFLKANPSSPLVDNARELKNYLEPMAKRDEIVDTLVKLLSSTLMSSLWMGRTQDGNCYYFTSEPENSVETTLSYIVDDTLKLQRHLFRKQETLTVSRAPQCHFANQAKVKLKGMGLAADWEAGMLAVYDLLKKDDQIDPVLRAIFVQNIMVSISQGSTPFREAAKNLKLEEFLAKIWTGKWMNPLETTSEMRSQARNAVVDLPDAETILAEVRKQRETSLNRVATRFVPIGFCLSDSANVSQYRLFKSSRVASRVGYPVVGLRQDDPKLWVPIGLTSANGVRATSSSKSARQGMLVFAVLSGAAK